MELIDTHCHLTFEELAGDVEAVIARSKDAGVVGWITIGTNTQQNRHSERSEKVPIVIPSTAQSRNLIK